jgi:hypothetical protein
VDWALWPVARGKERAGTLCVPIDLETQVRKRGERSLSPEPVKDVDLHTFAVEFAE